MSQLETSLGGNPLRTINASTSPEPYTLPALASGRSVTIRREDSGTSGNAVVISIPTGHTLDGVLNGTAVIPGKGQVVFYAINPGAWESYGNAGGVTGTDGAAVTSTSQIASDAAFTGTFAPGSNPFEKMPIYNYSHSYGAPTGGPGTTAGGRWCERMSSILRTAAISNQGVSGTTLSEICSKIRATWTPGNRGFVTLMGTVNSVQYLENQATVAESMRAALALLHASAIFPCSSVGFGYVGAWSAGSTVSIPGGVTSPSTMRTTTVGDYVDIYLPANRCFVLSQMHASTGGIITATRQGTGANIGTWNTGTAGTYNPHTSLAPLALEFNEPAGSTVRLTLTSGTGFTVDSLVAQNAVNPPIVQVFKEGPSSAYGINNGNTVAQNNALLENYHTATASVVSLWPAVVTTKLKEAGWDPLVMAWQVDGLHPHDGGQVFIAKVGAADIIRAVPAQRDGLNLITPAPTVTAALSGYYIGAPTAPPGPALSVAGPIATVLTLTATPKSNGGSPITGYAWQYRTNTGPGSWIDLANTANPNTSISGLTDGTLYDVRVAAINSIATGTYSTVTTSVPPYVIDTFTRADTGSLGTSTSGTAWTSMTANGISSNRAGGVASPVGNPSYLEVSQTDHAVRATVAVIGNCGVVARLTDVSNYWILTGSGSTNWQVYKRVAGTFVLAIDSAVPVATNDIIVLRCTGTSISATVNGVTLGAASDSFNSTATKAGLRLSDATARLDDFYVYAP